MGQDTEVGGVSLPSGPDAKKRRVTYFYEPTIGDYYYGQGHPMKPHRIRMAHNLIVHYYLHRRMEINRPFPAAPEDIRLFHSDEYVDFLAAVTPETLGENTFSRQLKRFNVGEDCPVFDGLFNFCQASAGGSIGAAVKLNRGDADIAINWAGGLHHAKKSEASGFCYVNDIVLGILELLKVRRVRTILDIGCGYGSFGAHLFNSHLLTMCIADYEPSGSQVQLTLERGLPAMIASFTSKQLPYPSLSFDMLHCARCGIDWDQKDGTLLIEADRLLKPGGYFVWTSPLSNAHSKENQKRWKFVHDFTENICWEMLSQQDETVIWKKTSKRNCYNSRNSGGAPPLCGKGYDVESPYYRELQNCIGGTHSSRWISIDERATWPSRANLNNKELATYGLQPEEFAEESETWRTVVRNYWSLLSPLIFSDHPKRPGEEDPSPPYNMLRNVLDMNAHFGGFNSALLQAGKSVWVMNVVPTSGPNYLPLIQDRGFVGVLHDWCEAFPTYPRTYDLVHAAGLLSLQNSQLARCTMLDLFTEIDRLLRPEGWIIIRDTVPSIESARALATRLKWDARVVELESDNDHLLLICQKPFFKSVKLIN